MCLKLLNGSVTTCVSCFCRPVGYYFECFILRLCTTLFIIGFSSHNTSFKKTKNGTQRIVNIILYVNSFDIIVIIVLS